MTQVTAAFLMITTIPSTDITEALKIVGPLAVPLVKAIVDEYIVPRAKSLATQLGKPDANDSDQVAAAFSEYLVRYYSRLSFVNTLVFPNQQILLSDIYVPLALSGRKAGETFPMVRWNADFIPQFKKVLITDTAGMGKSTLMKWLFLQAIDSCIKVPLYLELKSAKPNVDLVDHFIRELGQYDLPFSRDLFLALLKRGDFIFFFDGYDEIPFELRETVTQDLQNFISRASENWFVISSRKDPALSCFGDFKAFGINPLKRSEAFSLLRKYDRDANISEKIIAEIEANPRDQLRELLKNPLLVSLLFKCYSFKPKIPLRKPIFYRQVYDALYESHDFSKGGSFNREKHSRLDIDDFHTILRELGFATAKLGRVDLSKDKILTVLNEISQRRSDIPFQPSDFLRDLITTVPLFSNEGENYDWAHKSVQDYFAAQFIYVDAKQQRTQILNAIYESRNGYRFLNILDILHETDPLLLKHTIVRRLLSEFKAHHQISYRGEFPNVDESELVERRSLTFKRKSVLFHWTERGEKNSIKRRIDSIESEVAPLLAPDKLSSISFDVARAKDGGLVYLVDAFQPGMVLFELIATKYDCANASPAAHVPIPVWPLEGNVLVTESPDEEFNHPDLFATTNRILRNPIRKNLCYEKTSKLLAAIEREIAQSDAQPPLEVGI